MYVCRYAKAFGLSMALPSLHLVLNWRQSRSGDFVVAACTRCSLSTHLKPDKFQVPFVLLDLIGDQICDWAIESAKNRLGCRTGETS